MMKQHGPRLEAFTDGFFFSVGVMSGLFASILLAAVGVLAAWRYWGFWPL
jgi:hypothetical protein